MERHPFVPNGHYYSPVVDTEQAERERQRIWPPRPEILGIDFNEPGQRHLFAQCIPLIREYDYPEGGSDTGGAVPGFYDRNPSFSWLDARFLFAFLRLAKPKRMIEIGSGFSSLLSADVNVRFLNSAMHLICVEPYPADFLTSGVSGVTEFVAEPVQHVPLELFSLLRAGDVLFIDSSHVSKTGSDVNHIYFEILPRLAPGVFIHIHDIFLPDDYPQEWVIQEGRSWNEQYLLRALLMFTDGFEVVFGSAYAVRAFPDLVRDALRGKCFGGGSFWIRKRR